MRETSFNREKTSFNQQGSLAIAACFFNWAGFDRKTANLRRFLLQMQAKKIPVFGIEAVLPGQEAATQGFPGWRRVPANDRTILFQKEALLNRVVSEIPEHFTKIAWLDADVWFEHAAVFECAELMLENYPVVQLFDSAKWLDYDGSIELDRPSIARWNAHGRKGAISIGHTGFAWAARRELFSKYGGLFANCVTGSGDVYAAIAFCGVDPEQHPLLANDRQRLNADYKKWAWRIKEWTDGKVVYVPGTVYHEWHGSRRNRNYVKRHEVCSRIAKTDIIINEHGLHEWTPDAPPDVIESVKAYFLDRREDGDEEISAESTTQIPSAVSSAVGAASVVVTTHPAYVEFLEKNLKAIDEQSRPFAQKILVLDGFDVWPFESLPGWTVVNSFAKNPNASRNAGLRAVESDWVIFWDGDNAMPANYHEQMLGSLALSSRKTAFIYPSIDYVDAEGAAMTSLEVPEYDYWLMRERTFVDTSSLWSVPALRSVGGWIESQPKYDDYALALLLTRRGWRGAKSSARTSITQHPQRRSTVASNTSALWNARTLALATVWGPEKQASMNVLDWYVHSEKSPHTRVYWLDNSGSCEFRKKLEDYSASRLGVESVTIIDGGKPFDMTGKTHRAIGRHEHVANLYNVLLPQLGEDVVFLVEDDNVGPLDGIKKICEPLLANSSVAGVAGLYRSRANPSRAVASMDSQSWKSPLISEVKPEPVKVGMIGGGFTAYANWALRRCLPCFCTTRNGSLLGWDGNIGIEMAANGCGLILHGGVMVDHQCQEVLDFLSNEQIERSA